MKSMVLYAKEILVALVVFGLCLPSATMAQGITTIAGMGGAGYLGDGLPGTLAQLFQPHDCLVDASGNIYLADQYNNQIEKISSSGIVTAIAGHQRAGFFGDGLYSTSSLLYLPQALALDAIGNLYFYDFGNARIRKIDTSGIISTFLGGSYGYGGDGGPATSATISNIEGIVFDRHGNMYLADCSNHRIRKIDTSGTITTFGGTGTAGFSGDGGAATAAQLNYPNGVAVDTVGNIYITDLMNNRIRKINSSGIISTIAGTGSYGYSGDGGAATGAQIGDAYGISSDLIGNIYITGTNRIRKINTSGTITTVVGTGVHGYNGDGGAATATNINLSFGVHIDRSGNLFIAESGNHRLRKVNTSGVISTIAGMGFVGFSGDGGSGLSAELSAPAGLGLDTTGNLFIADAGNNRIRKVAPSGIITTLAGNGAGGYSGDGGPATAASLKCPTSVCADRSGNIFIADVQNNRIRKINSSGIISTIAGTGTAGFGGDGGPATSALLNSPRWVSVDTSGNLYIADLYNFRVRKVNVAGIISTIAGNGTDGYTGDGGAATSAEISPFGVATDNFGNIYISSMSNVRKVTPSGVITTIIGTGTYGFSGDGGPATAAQIMIEGAPAIDIYGYIYIADRYNNRIRKISPSGVINTIANYYGYPGDLGGSIALVCGLISPYGIAINNSREVYFSEDISSKVRKIGACSNPVVGMITGSSTVCVGSSTILSDTTGGGIWSVNATSVASVNATTGTIYGIAIGVAIATYTVTNSCGPTSVFDTVHIISSPFAGVITGPATICVGSSATLTDSAGATGGTWTSSATSVATVNSTTGVVRGISTGTAIITYSVTNSCGTNITTHNVNIITTLSPGTLSGTTTFCQGTTSTLTSSGTSGGVWSSSASSIATVNTTGVVTGLSAGTAVISYTVTNVCGSATASSTVTINPLANPGTISGAAMVCLGDTIVLHNSVSGGTWSSSNPSLATVCTTGIVYGIATGSVTISYSVTNSCGTAHAVRSVTVSTIPAGGTISGATTLCAGASISLSGSVSGGSWGSTSTHATVNSTGVVHGLSAGVAIISYTFTNSCGSVSDTFSVYVVGVPHAGPITGVLHVCPGSTTSLSGATSGGTWSSVTPSIATVDTSGIVTGLMTGLATIVYITSNSCGTDTAVQIITVDPLPYAGTILGTDSICPGDTLTLTNSVTSGSWSSSNTSLAVVSGSGLVTGIASGSVTIRYIVVNICGSDTATFPFTVRNSALCPSDIRNVTYPRVNPVSLYPNPTNGTLIIERAINCEVHFYDILGRMVTHMLLAANKEAVDISSLANGIYVVQVTNVSDGAKVVFKVLKE